MAVAFFDGSSTPNPGKCGCGAILYINGDVVDTISIALGYGTNNFAEYMGAYEAIILCIKHGVKKATIKGDSLLIINQLNGIWRVKNERLAKIHTKLKELCSKNEYSFEHVPREKNAFADKLSKEAVI